MEARLRTVPAVLALLMLVALGGLGPLLPHSEARIIRGLALDKDVGAADLIAVMKVTSSVFKKKGWYAEQKKGRRKPTPDGTGLPVDFHEVSATVLVPIKGPKKMGGTVVFRHRRRGTPTNGPSINGFTGRALKLNTTYLLVLREEADGVLAVSRPEHWFYATYPENMHRTLPARPKAACDLDYVLRLLLARFDHGETPDHVGIASLFSVLRSKAGLALAQTPKFRPAIVKRLVPLVEQDRKSGTRSQVFRMLTRLDQTRATEVVVNWILDASLRSHARWNLVRSLRTLEAVQQLAALDRIVAHADDEEVRALAERDRADTRARVAREKERERLRHGAPGR